MVDSSGNLSSSERSTVATAAQILADQQAALAADVSPAYSVKCITRYVSRSATDLVVTFVNSGPAVNRIGIIWSLGNGTANNCVLGSSGSTSYVDFIEIGQSRVSRTLAIAAMPADGLTNVITIGNLQPASKFGYGGYAVTTVTFETGRPVAMPNNYVLRANYDMATTAITPLGDGNVSGGVDTRDNMTPCFCSYEHFTSQTSNNGQHAFYVDPLMMSGDCLYYVNPDTGVQPFPIISGKRYFRNEYLTTALRDPFIGDGMWSGPAYGAGDTGSRMTQAWALSNNVFHFKYGWVEVRAKYPTAANWPICWWTTGSIAYPPEIDMAERLPYAGAGSQSFNTHPHPASSETVIYNSFTLSDFQPGANINNWNVYTCHWTKTYIDFYFNGVFLTRIDNTKDVVRGMSRFLMQAQAGDGYLNNADAAYGLGAGVNGATDMGVDYVKIWVSEDVDIDEAYYWKNTAVTTSRSGYYWDTSFAPPGWTLSNGNTVVKNDKALLAGDLYEVATRTDAMNFCDFIFRTYGSASGSDKKYAKIQLYRESGMTGGSSYIRVGLVTSSHHALGRGSSGLANNFADRGVKLNSLAYTESGAVRFNNATIATIATYNGAEDTIEIAVDRGNDRVWFRVTTAAGSVGNWNNDAGANPATGTGSITLPAKLTGTLMAAVNMTQSASTTNWTEKEWSATLVSGTPPSGFTNF